MHAAAEAFLYISVWVLVAVLPTNLSVSSVRDPCLNSFPSSRSGSRALLILLPLHRSSPREVL